MTEDAGRPRPPASRRSTVALAVGLSALLFATCSPDRGPDPDELSLLWISLDTVRADHLELYGYERDTSPFLKELAERGLYFEWAISPQNSTLPTHLSQFTGIHPVVHGVMHSRRNVGVRLADSVRTLPEVLRDQGFRTRAWTDGGKMSGHYGFARGFETYDTSRAGLRKTLRAALDSLSELSPGERFFYFIHTYEAHSPYKPPGDYRQLFQQPEAGLTARKLSRYDGSIRFIDDSLREFVGELERRGLLERTVLTLTADHGESFNEYGIRHVGHSGDNMHQNVTRVPWILVHPGERYRGRVDKPVGLIDFANTMLPLVGVDESLPGQGIDVLAADAPEARGYVSWTGEPRRRGCAWSLFSATYHWLECAGEEGPERNGAYHVARDPLERNPVRDPELTARLRAELAELRRELVEERAARLDSLRDFGEVPEETLDQLRALGYLGGMN